MNPTQLTSSMRLKFCRLLAVCLLSGVADAASQPPPLMSVPTPVQDLYYGDALFYFYQDDYFRSLVHLDAAITLGRVPHHQTEAELLKGALYLSLGLHSEAGKIFQALLQNNVAIDVRDRAWFYLGKIWYQRGYLQQAEQAFAAIQGQLPAELEAERRMLAAQVLLNAQRYDQAITALQAFDAQGDRKVSPNWLAYARFNLGVALIRQQRTEEAISLLDRVGTMVATDEEMLALRDKANLALGFTLLSQQRSTEAETMLQRVRLQGPQSNKALLGLGWAQANSKQFEQALAPWLELKQRDLLDAAVQEAFLAIPYAYSQLGADGQAADYYRFAIDSFDLETQRLTQSIEAIQQGALLQTVLANDKSDQSGWYWQLKNLPDQPATRYLYDLLASNVFQEALKNYRDIRQMQVNLKQWVQSLDAFKNVVDTRQVAFVQRAEAMQHALDAINIDEIEARVVELQSKVAAIEQTEDLVSLATPEEQMLWQRVTHLQEAIAQSDTDAALPDLQDKVRLMRGALLWQMNSAYKARLWRETKEVRELAVAAKEARRRHTLVERAREQVPQRNATFGERVQVLEPRLQALLAVCQQAEQLQTNYLSKLAVTQLQQQTERLAQYRLQAQFSLAAIYDRAVTGKTNESSTTSTQGEAP